MIQKAFAKLHGSYWHLTLGTSASAIYKDLTGLPGRRYSLEQTNLDKLKRIVKMLSDHSISIMAKTSPIAMMMDPEAVQLVEDSKYYRVIGCFEVLDDSHVPARLVNLVKLQAFSKKDIKDLHGSWGFFDPRWNEYNIRVGDFKEDDHLNGMFYIESGFFLRNFDYLDVLLPYKITQMNTQLRIPPVELKNDFHIFQMLVKAPGNYQITISQPGLVKGG